MGWVAMALHQKMMRDDSEACAIDAAGGASPMEAHLIRVLSACETLEELRYVWVEDLTEAARALPAVVAAKDRLKGLLPPLEGVLKAVIAIEGADEMWRLQKVWADVPEAARRHKEVRAAMRVAVAILKKIKTLSVVE